MFSNNENYSEYNYYLELDEYLECSCLVLFMQYSVNYAINSKNIEKFNLIGLISSKMSLNSVIISIFISIYTMNDRKPP